MRWTSNYQVDSISVVPAYVRRTLAELCSESPTSLLGELAAGNARASFPITPEQIEAWRFQLPPLQRAAALLTEQFPGAASWAVLLEYPIPRIGKRIDAVLLMHDVIAVLEFKTGESRQSAAAQVEDYAQMLRDFHENSRAQVVLPIAIYREVPNTGSIGGTVERCVSASFNSLGETLAQLWKRFTSQGAAIDAQAWDRGRFVPIPPIIDAAVALYSGTSVFEIEHACAPHHSLETATNTIVSAVESARATSARLIVFVTGVPGAGKTLVGLNAAHHSSIKDCTSFLSGNRPLVLVLKEALIRSVVERQQLTRKRAEHVIETFIHNVHRFAEDYYANTTVPAQHVIVFDEAQRAWNEKQNAKKYERTCSEPEMLLSIMERPTPWSVIVALVGGGQEINTGEAGLSEWGRALLAHPQWEVWAPLQAIRGDVAVSGQRLFEEKRPAKLRTKPELHLEVSLRSIHATHNAQWVDAVLQGNSQGARRIAERLDQKPLLTRSLGQARAWLRSRRTGSSRAGLVGSASAARLRSDGLEPSYDFHRFFEWANWFLDDPETDARSSSMLEVHATQFEIQGLELDWVGLCWGDDFVRQGSSWRCYRFNDRKWRPLLDMEKQRFLINAYRVLLTRARQGLIIYVPSSTAGDFRNLEALEETADYLVACGAELYADGASADAPNAPVR